MPFDPLTEDSTDLGRALRDHEAAQAQGNRFGSDRAGDKFIRLIPPIVTDEKDRRPFAFEYGVHFQFDMLRGLPGIDPRRLVCPALTLQQDCYACTVNARMASEARGEGGIVNPRQHELARATSASPRFVANVIEVTQDNRAIEQKMLLWEYGVRIQRQLLTAFADHQKFAPITHPQRGYVLRVTFEKSGEYGVTAKSVTVRPESGPIPVEGWPDLRYDLEKVVLAQTPSPQQVRDFFRHHEAGAALLETTTQPHRIAGAADSTREPLPTVIDGVDCTGIDPKIVEKLYDIAQADAGIDFQTLIDGARRSAH